MKTEDCSTENIEIFPPESGEKLMGRRELLNKAGIYALSAATMVVLLKSQPAKAQSARPMAPTAMPKPEGSTWQRTTRS